MSYALWKKFQCEKVPENILKCFAETEPHTLYAIVSFTPKTV